MAIIWISLAAFAGGIVAAVLGYLGGVAVADTELLKVTYTPQITV